MVDGFQAGTLAQLALCACACSAGAHSADSSSVARTILRCMDVAPFPCLGQWRAMPGDPPGLHAVLALAVPMLRTPFPCGPGGTARARRGGAAMRPTLSPPAAGGACCA